MRVERPIQQVRADIHVVGFNDVHIAHDICHSLGFARQCQVSDDHRLPINLSILGQGFDQCTDIACAERGHSTLLFEAQFQSL